MTCSQKLKLPRIIKPFHPMNPKWTIVCACMYSRSSSLVASLKAANVFGERWQLNCYSWLSIFKAARQLQCVLDCSLSNKLDPIQLVRIFHAIIMLRKFYE